MHLNDIHVAYLFLFFEHNLGAKSIYTPLWRINNKWAPVCK